MKATAFRADMYRVLKRVLDEGRPAEVELQGRIVEIRPKPQAGGKLERLTKRVPVSNIDPHEVVWDIGEWEKTVEQVLPTPTKKKRPSRHSK